MLKFDISLDLGGACKDSMPNNAESDEETDVLYLVFSKIESSMWDTRWGSVSEPMMESYEVRFAYQSLWNCSLPAGLASPATEKRMNAM